MSAQGNANGAASIARGNAWQGGLQNIANNYQQQNTLDSQANASQLRRAEEAEKLRIGAGSKKVVEANAIADKIRRRLEAS